MAGGVSRRSEHRLDMTSGRVRRADFVFSFQVSEHEIETPFTKFSPAGARPTDSRSWKTFSSSYEARWFWGFDNRGSYAAGSVNADLKEFAMLCEIYSVPDEERSLVVDRLLIHLRAGDADAIARDVDAFQKKLEAAQQGTTVTPE